MVRNETEKEPGPSRISPVPGSGHSLNLIVRNLRLWTGLVLVFFLALHLLNLALGLISLEAMAWGEAWLASLWRSPVGTAILYLSLIGHIFLALWAVYQRHNLIIPPGEALRILLGFIIVPLLAIHVVGVRIAQEWFDVSVTYKSAVLVLWKTDPGAGWRQAGLLAAAWVHGCLGLHLWLRVKKGYSRYSHILFALMLLIPAVALLGFSQAGKEVTVLAEQPGWVEATLKPLAGLGPERVVALDRATALIIILFGIGIGAMILAWLLRRRLSSRAMVRITYAPEGEITVPAGFSVLEASQKAGIPHAGVCGGRGRCTTCRVSVLDGAGELPRASIEERRILDHIKAPPNVRLGCQLRPTGDLTVAPLVKAGSMRVEELDRAALVSGHEQDIVIMFADIRGFTAIAEEKLPYDVVFLLNSYFDVVGRAIERAGGLANQFTGDGVMALFGMEVPPERACAQALASVCEIIQGLEELSEAMSGDLDGPLRIGIGIHTGPAVVGHMGHGIATYLTAVGDTVHVASRLQELTKEYSCQAVISDLVVERAGIGGEEFPHHELRVRNRNKPIGIRAVDDLNRLARCLAPEELVGGGGPGPSKY